MFGEKPPASKEPEADDASKEGETEEKFEEGAMYGGYNDSDELRNFNEALYNLRRVESRTDLS